MQAQPPSPAAAWFETMQNTPSRLAERLRSTTSSTDRAVDSRDSTTVRKDDLQSIVREATTEALREHHEREHSQSSDEQSGSSRSLSVVKLLLGAGVLAAAGYLVQRQREESDRGLSAEYDDDDMHDTGAFPSNDTDHDEPSGANAVDESGVDTGESNPDDVSAGDSDSDVGTPTNANEGGANLTEEADDESAESEPPRS